MVKQGRPKKTLNDLPDNWEEGVLELASKGASDVELRVYLGISDDLWYRLIDEDESFSLTIKKAARACRLWWEKQGRENLENKDFSPTLWYMNMKNRFGWRDKVEQTVNLTGNLAGALASITVQPIEDTPEPKKLETGEAP